MAAYGIVYCATTIILVTSVITQSVPNYSSIEDSNLGRNAYIEQMFASLVKNCVLAVTLFKFCAWSVLDV